MPWRCPRRGATGSRCGSWQAMIALRRGDLAGGARELADAARAALSRSRTPGAPRAQYYLPLARLEAELCLGRRQAGGRAGRPSTAAADQFDLARDPRYAWPLLAVGARDCTAAAAGRAAPAAVARRAADLLGRLIAAGRQDGRAGARCSRPGGCTFAAASRPRAAVVTRCRQWDAAAAAWDQLAEPYQVADRAAARRGGRAGRRRPGRRGAAAAARRPAGRPAGRAAAGRPRSRRWPGMPGWIWVRAGRQRARTGPAGPDRPRVRGAAPGRRRAGRTRRSPPSCSSRPRRPACTCRTSWPSSA